MGTNADDNQHPSRRAAWSARATSLVRRALARLGTRGVATLGPLLEHGHDAILVIGENGEVEHRNRAAIEMFGIKPDDGRHDVTDFVKPGVQEPGIHEAVGLRADGGPFPVEIAVSDSSASAHAARLIVIRDITHRKARERELIHRATHDALTGLPNRARLRDVLDARLVDAATSGEPLSVVLLDLDHFKDINDSLGHPIGDQLLRRIGERLQGGLRDSDMIARMGGDEFAVVLPATESDEGLWIAERLIETLQEPIEVEGLRLRVGTSAGVATFPVHGSIGTDLIQRADVAMYVAKRGRAGVSVYRPEDDFSSVRQLTLNGELRKAIAEDHLGLFFQPKIDARTGDVVCVEALVRWVHPKHGILPPDEFIGLAENSGLIRPLTRWVVDRAVRQCAAWRGDGADLTVAVNLSARNLLEDDLPTVVRNRLAVHGLAPEALTLEITEGLIMEDPERSMEVITELGALGVRISIDDFGTGYSSLAYLKKLPAAEIKIDRSFVSQMDRDRDDAVIVRSTIELAHSLGMSVVAEGVENAVVWQELQELGCDFGQGYLFSPPLPVDAVETWMRSHTAVPAIERESEAARSGRGAPAA